MNIDYKRILNINNWSVLAKIYLKVTILAFLFSTASVIINGLPWYQVLLFTVYEIGAIVTPGFAILLLLRFRLKSDIEMLTIGFAVGYIFQLLLYYMLVPFGLQVGVRYLVILAMVVSAGIVWRFKKNMELEIDKKGNIICGIFIVVLLIMELIVISGVNMLVPRLQENVYSNDTLYWVGNVIALMKQYPPKEFRVYLEGYNYHYFTSMQIAVCSFFTGIRPLYLCFCYAYFQPILLLILGCYSTLKKITNKYWIIILGILAMYFTTGEESAIKVSYINHMFVNPFAFDMGIAMIFIVLYFLISQSEEKKFDWKLFVFTMILFGATLGVKAPAGVVVLMEIGMLCFAWLIRGRWKMAFGYGFPILAVFIVVYLLVVNVSGYSFGQSLGDYIKEVAKMDPDLVTLRKSYSFLSDKHIPCMIKESLFFVIYTIRTHWVIFSLFWISLSVKAIILRKWDTVDTACVAATMGGFFISLPLYMFGKSQIYFMMCTYPLAMLFAMRGITQLYENERFSKWKLRFIPLMAIVWLYFMGFQFYWQPDMAYGFPLGMSYYLKVGTTNIGHAMTNTNGPLNDVLHKRFQHGYINEDMYDMFEYIRANTDSEALFVSNDNNWTCGVYAERYLVRQKKPVRHVIREHRYEELQPMLDMGASYLLWVEEEGDPVDILPEEYGKVLMKNDTATLYELCK